MRTIEKSIGDAVMAVWGAPVAHEDDAERAVRAALEIVTQLPSITEGEFALPARAGAPAVQAARDALRMLWQGATQPAERSHD